MDILKSILDLLFPPKCVICSRVTDECGICEKCGEKLKVKGRLPDMGEFFSDCCGVYEYRLVRDSVLRFKFKGKSMYAAVYAKYLADVINEEYHDRYDLITWVPVSRKRLRSRGYDQSRLLAEKTALLLGKEAEMLLKKIKDTPAQSTFKTKERRKANVTGVYEAPEEDKIRGKRILLIDDIITTGATMSECARTLLMAGAEEVVCAVFAVA